MLIKIIILSGITIIYGRPCTEDEKGIAKNSNVTCCWTNDGVNLMASEDGTCNNPYMATVIPTVFGSLLTKRPH